MNVHHLELFYYTALHGGISAGMRKIPYGIQQPAISGQLLQLERNLGLNLFQRRPFALTPAGQELFDFIAPFFGGLPGLPERLRNEGDLQLRLAASTTILRDYLPSLLKEHQRHFPISSIQLHSANQAAAEALLRKQEIDLAITELEGRPAAGVNCAILFKLPLVLIVPKSLKIKNVAELWRKGGVERTLISLPPTEVITKQFQAGLRQLKVNWATGVEVTAIDLIPTYTLLGFGLGATVLAPGTRLDPHLRAIPLPKFRPLILAALWNKNLSVSSMKFLAEVKARAAKIQQQAQRAA